LALSLLVAGAGERVVGPERASRYNHIAYTRVVGQDSRDGGGRTAGASTLVEDVADGLRGKGAAPVGLAKGPFHFRRTVLVEQSQETMGGAAEVSPMQRDALQERLGARARGHEPVAAAMLVRMAFLVGQAVQVARVFNLKTTFPGALVHRNVVVAIEHADYEVRSDERERLLRQGVRDGVVVSVEAHIGRFSRPNGDDGVAIEAVRGQRQKARSLFDQRDGDRPLFRIPWNDAGVSDTLDPIGELGVEVVKRMKATGRKERIAQIANGRSTRPFSFPRAGATGLGAKW
jgi:hypothetical protein